jgi:hypothetical protein
VQRDTAPASVETDNLANQEEHDDRDGASQQVMAVNVYSRVLRCCRKSKDDTDCVGKA